MSIRRRFLHIARPVTRLLDRINMRFGRPPLTGAMYLDAMTSMRSGDILLTRTAWRPTNLFIPGRWSHAVMVVDSAAGQLVEARMPNARILSMVDIWAACSDVKIVRPQFLTQAEQAGAAIIALSLVGTPYDLEFDSSDKALYCSELIMLAMRAKAKKKVPKIGRMAYGEYMTIPEDFDNPELFDTVFDAAEWSEEDVSND